MLGNPGLCCGIPLGLILPHGALSLSRPFHGLPELSRSPYLHMNTKRNARNHANLGHDCYGLRSKELLRRRDAAAFIRFGQRVETLMQTCKLATFAPYYQLTLHFRADN
jgi:hypothetical protein